MLGEDGEKLSEESKLSVFGVLKGIGLLVSNDESVNVGPELLAELDSNGKLLVSLLRDCPVYHSYVISGKKLDISRQNCFSAAIRIFHTGNSRIRFFESARRCRYRDEDGSYPSLKFAA